ncbi:MAG: Fur family transcriptional regulator, partial [Parvibaculaceae bacterium]
MRSDQNLTKNQALVLGALARMEGPTGAYALLDALRGHGFRAPLQVYRALEKLIELGLVHRLESLNSFVACAHPHDHIHGLIAFAICESCGQVDEFPDAVVEKR